MPVTSSAKKALRRDEGRRQVNQKMRTRLKTAISEFEAEPTADQLPKLYSVIDRASKKQIIHPNKAARLKSKLQSQVKKTQAKSSKKKTSSKKAPKKS